MFVFIQGAMAINQKVRTDALSLVSAVTLSIMVTSEELVLGQTNVKNYSALRHHWP